MKETPGDVSKESPRDFFHTDLKWCLAAPWESLKTYPALMVSQAEDPAGPEAAGEKEGPEEEEEEDFDDLTQDEEDEMSSASEESVLSVPELQVRVGHSSPIFCGFSNRFIDRSPACFFQ